jgi:hypothetical protein
MKPPKKSNQPAIAIITIIAMIIMMYLEFYSAQVKKRADWEAERKAETRNR